MYNINKTKLVKKQNKRYVETNKLPSIGLTQQLKPLKNRTLDILAFRHVVLLTYRPLDISSSRCSGFFTLSQHPFSFVLQSTVNPKNQFIFTFSFIMCFFTILDVLILFYIPKRTGHPRQSTAPPPPSDLILTYRLAAWRRGCKFKYFEKLFPLHPYSELYPPPAKSADPHCN